MKDIPYLQKIGESYASGGSSSAISGGGSSGSGLNLGTGGGGSGFSGGGAGGSGGGAGGGSSAGVDPTGATSAKNLVDRLTDITGKFSDLQFLVDTGGISKKAGIAQLDALTKEFRVLENQANALTSTPSTGMNFSSGRLGEKQTMVTINMGIVGDPEGAARAVEQVFQDSLARGGISSTVGAYDR